MVETFEFTTALLRTRVRNERAANLVEYAMLMAFIAIVCVAAVATLGKKTGSSFSSVSTGL